MGYMRRDIMWLRISLCDVLHSASRVHVVYSCVFVYEYSLSAARHEIKSRCPKRRILTLPMRDLAVIEAARPLPRRAAAGRCMRN